MRSTVVIGSLLNLLACSNRVAGIAREAGGDVLVQCAGVGGAFTMDDAYAAGRYVQELAVWLPEYELTDAAHAAEALAGTFESAGEGLAASRSARNLRDARPPRRRSRSRSRGSADIRCRG